MYIHAHFMNLVRVKANSTMRCFEVRVPCREKMETRFFSAACRDVESLCVPCYNLQSLCARAKFRLYIAILQKCHNQIFKVKCKCAKIPVFNFKFYALNCSSWKHLKIKSCHKYNLENIAIYTYDNVGWFNNAVIIRGCFFNQKIQRTFDLFAMIFLL
jgi:hypothetical protein